MADKIIICGLGPAWNSKFIKETGKYEVFGPGTTSGNRLRFLLGGVDGQKLLANCELENVIEDRILEKKVAGERGDERPLLPDRIAKFWSFFQRARNDSDNSYRVVLFDNGAWSEVIVSLRKDILPRAEVTYRKIANFRFRICPHPAGWSDFQPAQTPGQYFWQLQRESCLSFPSEMFEFLGLKIPVEQSPVRVPVREAVVARDEISV